MKGLRFTFAAHRGASFDDTGGGPETRATAQSWCATLDTVNHDPEARVDDFSGSPTTEYRERVERAHRAARERYRDYLAAVFDQHGADEAMVLADVALDALTVWRDSDTGDRCTCVCHPRLPETDLHDFGFDCVCTRPPETRRRTFEGWGRSMEAFWASPEGQQIQAKERAADAELQAWLQQQPGVIVDNHGGLIPEEWTGEVDGHNFEFRERHGQWRIELDIRPRGRSVPIVDSTDSGGTVHYRQHELEEGDIVAEGTVGGQGYGTTPVERAAFIVEAIRTHLTQQACTLHREDLSPVAAAIGAQAGWCPVCGVRLPTR